MTVPDYLIISFYLVLMLYIGAKCKKSSVNFSDYVRMGSRSTWWLAGSSVFMTMFSAITFTGICGSAYLAGWSVLVIFWCNALMFFIQALLFAPLLRRTRADTAMDAVRLRFGSGVEQVLVYFGTLSSFFWGGTFLLSFATFLSVVFNIPLWILILVVGGVVVFYSVAGGAWSVQITDSLQSLLLVAVTVAFCFLSLHRIGGLEGLFAAIDAAGLQDDFALVKPANHEYKTPIPVEKGMFTSFWVFAMLFNSILGAANLQTSHRYLSLTDERGAQKAAMLAGFLMIIGSLVWFIPPVVGRLLFSEQVEMVQGLGNRADAAYAVTAINILPPGLVGLIVVAMAAATMSSMDSFLTGSSGVIVKNLYLPLARLLKWPQLEGLALLRLTRFVNFGMGMWCICMAFILHNLGGSAGIFGIMMATIALLGPPTSLPIILGLLFRKLPLWGFFLGMGTGFCASLTIFLLQRFDILFLMWYQKIFTMAAATMLPTLVSRFFWHHSSKNFRDLVDNFFVQIHTPIRVKEEVGANIDHTFLRTVGNYLLISAGAVGLLYIPAETPSGHVAVVCISLFLLGIGLLMRLNSSPPPSETTNP